MYATHRFIHFVVTGFTAVTSNICRVLATFVTATAAFVALVVHGVRMVFKAFERPAELGSPAHPLAVLVQAVQFALYRRRLEARDRPHVRDTLRLCA